MLQQVFKWIVSLAFYFEQSEIESLSYSYIHSCNIGIWYNSTFSTAVCCWVGWQSFPNWHRRRHACGVGFSFLPSQILLKHICIVQVFNAVSFPPPPLWLLQNIFNSIERYIYIYIYSYFTFSQVSTQIVWSLLPRGGHLLPFSVNLFYIIICIWCGTSAMKNL